MPLTDVSSVIRTQPPPSARSPIKPSWSARAAGMKIASALAERALIERLDSRAIWRLPPTRRSSACRRSTRAFYPARQWRRQSRSGIADHARGDVDDADRRNGGRQEGPGMAFGGHRARRCRRRPGAAQPVPYSMPIAGQVRLSLTRVLAPAQRRYAPSPVSMRHRLPCSRAWSMAMAMTVRLAQLANCYCAAPINGEKCGVSGNRARR